MRRLAWLIATCLLIAGLTPARAQDANLLRDGGMEGTFTQRGRADLNLPADWMIQIAELPRSEVWMNQPPVGFPHNGPDPSPQLGGRAVNLGRNSGTFTAALYQQVAVPSGAVVTASAYAFLRTCDIPLGAGSCRSNADSGAFTRIGIDPNGGTDAFSPAVVWSANLLPHEYWGQMTVSTTAVAEIVTLFLYVTQAFPRQINQVYWDSAFLAAGAAGAVLPTAALEVGFVAPQGERPDGSIVHVVQSGDTIDSIAVAYRLTRDQLLAVNPGMSRTRFLQIGQEVIIRPPQPTPVPTDTPQPTATFTFTPVPTDTPAPTSTPLPTLTFTPVPTDTPPPTPTPTSQPTAVESVAAPEGAPLEVASLPTAESPEMLLAEPPPGMEAGGALMLPVAAVDEAPVVEAQDGVVFPIDPLDERASICIVMFNDANFNRLRDGDERLAPGGRVTLTLNGTVLVTHITNDLDPTCYDDLPSGVYTAEAEAPDSFGLTSPARLRVTTTGGAQIRLAFGAAPGVVQVTAIPPDVTPSAIRLRSDEPEAPPTRRIGLFVLGGAAAVFVMGMILALLLRWFNR